MDRLEGFVPGALRQRLQAADADESVATSATFSGAVLFVDVSGYTWLAETLCSQGVNGVETLGQTLNQAFRSHVNAVYETGGEIACFAGDAFIAYWVADDGSVPRVLERAHECARLLHAASERHQLSPSIIAPALHIGVGAGEMWAARLGADERWQLLLAGPSVRAACRVAGNALPGQTVVAPAAAPFGVPPGRAATAVTGHGSTDRPRATTSPFVTHVPRRVQDYADQGYSEWVPQARTICALFVRIEGLDETAVDALPRHQAAVTSLHIALRPYTSSTGTLLLDDKGLVFTLCLGMPHDSHADDALRAVRAGFAIRSELARQGVGCRIGVAAGQGVCMPIGGPERQHYWAVGRFMHVAGRLMEAADVDMLCTDEVADRVRRVMGLSPTRPLTLKGLRWPLQAFRVWEATTLISEPDVLYGREEEQASLDQHLDRFENGRGSVVWMTAAAGLGKSALVQYLRHEVQRRQLRYLQGGAGSVEIDVPYAAWRPVFAALLADPPGTAPSSEADRRARLGDLRHPQLAPLVNAVAPAFLEDTAVVQRLSGQARADATLSVLSEVLATNTSSRFVLVIEDCHWMDSASWRLLLRVTQDHRDPLIVLTSRPVAEVEELAALRSLDRFVELKVAPLLPAAIEAIVHSVLGGVAARQELVAEITERAVGNPLFAREYALLLTAHASQREFGATPAAARSGPPGLPVTVQSLIAGRLDGLSPSEELALKAASVIGDRFNLAMLSHVYPGHARDALESVVTQLIDHQLIVRDAVAGETYAFQHALIREVTYQQLTGEQRRNLHRRVAEYLEREHQRDLRSHLAELAHHWSHAEVPSSTIKYADQAASQALAGGAFSEADRLMGTCIQLAKTGGQTVAAADRVRWHRQIADARHGMGHLEARGAAAHQALRLAGRPRAHSSVGLVVQAGVHLLALKQPRLVPAAWHFADASLALDVARAYRHSAEVCYFNNDMLGMICDSLSAVACASSLPPSAVLACASTELGGILSIAGFRKRGERILQRAIAMAEAAGDQSAQAHAHMVSCLYFVGVGDWRLAELSAGRCQSVCEPIDDRVNWTNAQAVRFWMSHYRSHDAAAYDAARSLNDRATQTGNRQHRAWALRFLALCALRADHPRDAMTHLQSALGYLGETAAHNERVASLGLLALAQLRSGDTWSARATAKEGLSQIAGARRPIGHSTLEGYSSLVTVALDAWNEEQSPQWRRAVTMCLRVLRRYRRSFPVGAPRYELHQGDYRRLAGWTRAARWHYRRSEAAATRLGMPWEAARAREARERLSAPP